MYKKIKLLLLKTRWYFFHPVFFLKFVKHKLYNSSNLFDPLSQYSTMPFRAYVKKTAQWKMIEFKKVDYEWFVSIQRKSDNKIYLLDNPSFLLLQLIELNFTNSDILNEAFIQFGLGSFDTKIIILRLKKTFIL